MCVDIFRTGLVFSETIDLRGNKPRLSLKNECFSHLSPWETPYMCVETLRTGLILPRWSDLRGDIPRFTLKNEHFFHVSPKKPYKCVLRPSEQHFIFLRQSIWGVTCLGLLWKWMFSHMYLHRNPINVCWNPQNRACFSETIDLRVHMPRFTLKMNVFPSISIETP